MRFLLAPALAALAAACSSATDDVDSSSDALSGASYVELGSVQFELPGASLKLVSWTRVTSLKFSAIVVASDDRRETFRCWLGDANGGGAALRCGDIDRTRFVIDLDRANPSVTKGPDGAPSSLSLEGGSRSLTVRGTNDLDAFSVADRLLEAFGQAGSFSLPGEDGSVSIKAWQLIDAQVDFDATLRGSDGSETTVRCHDSSAAPDLWASDGSPRSGLASSGELADRIKTLAEWKFANCRRYR
jgi:hypothetical protein